MYKNYEHDYILAVMFVRRNAKSIVGTLREDQVSALARHEEKYREETNRHSEALRELMEDTNIKGIFRP